MIIKDFIFTRRSWLDVLLLKILIIAVIAVFVFLVLYLTTS